MVDEEHGSGLDTIAEDRVQTDQPPMYKVVLLNDDYTTMDFVVAVLETVFKKSPAESVQIMLKIHNSGRGVCGVFTRQIAEAKITLVHERARQEGFPLRCTMEEA